MRETSKPQLALEWTDGIRWGELPEAVRTELRLVLAELLRQTPADGVRAEGEHDE